MSYPRLLVIAVSLTLLAACPLVDEGWVPPPECYPGEEECVGENNDYRECDTAGQWSDPEPVVPCTTGSCAVMSGIAMCM